MIIILRENSGKIYKKNEASTEQDVKNKDDKRK